MKTNSILQMNADPLRWLPVCSLLATALYFGTELYGVNAEPPPDPALPAGPDFEELLITADVPHEPVVLEPGKGNEVAWLGVSTKEAPALLASHLKLEPGTGLVVSFVADESPAEDAGLTKNDLLVEFNGHQLVHPSQLQKLVQSRKPGDSIELVYYRNGERQTTSTTLVASPGWDLGDPKAWQQHFRGIEHQLREMHTGEAWQRQMKEWEQSMKHLEFEQERVQEYLKRAVEEAQRAANDPAVQRQIQRAIEQSMKAVENGMRAGEHPLPMPHPLPSPPGPRVTVRSSGTTAQSLVHADETGTYVLVRNPRSRLTVHDADGTLLFDGEIETPEQRADVPEAVWEKAEPLVERLNGFE